jgi:hypothetical protein
MSPARFTGEWQKMTLRLHPTGHGFESELLEDEHIYKQPILDLILAALLRPSFLRSEHNNPTLTNEDVITLVHSVSESVVVRVIHAYHGSFDTSTAELAHLRNRGVGDEAIEAMRSKQAPSSLSHFKPTP